MIYAHLSDLEQSVLKKVAVTQVVYFLSAVLAKYRAGIIYR